MKKSAIMTILALFLAGFITGCGDGRHTSRPGWSLSNPSNSLNGDEATENVGVATLTCIDVMDYEDFDYNNLPAETPTELAEGDVSNKAAGAVDTMTKLATPKAASNSNSIEKCIEDEIDSMKSSGSEHYWNNLTWLVTRNKTKKPATSAVTIESFKSCSQIQAADCLLID